MCGSGGLLAAAAPIALGIAAPELLPAMGIAGLTTAEAVGIGAGVGGIGAGLATGKGFGGALEQGAISGGLGYGGASLFGPTAEGAAGATGAEGAAVGAGAPAASGAAAAPTFGGGEGALDLTTELGAEAAPAGVNLGAGVTSGTGLGTAPAFTGETALQSAAGLPGAESGLMPVGAAAGGAGGIPGGDGGGNAPATSGGMISNEKAFDLSGTGVGSPIKPAGDPFAISAGESLTTGAAPGAATYPSSGFGAGAGDSTTAALNSAGTTLASDFGTTAGPGSSGILSDIGGILKDNKNLILPAAGMAYSAMNQQQPQNLSALEASAAQLAGQGSTLTSALTTGQLPAGMQNAIKTATNSAKASIRSQYASMGMSGSTAEQAALAQVDSNAVTQALGMAQSLAQTGMSQTGMANEIYDKIMQVQMGQDQALQTAIANFAIAAGGGGLSSRRG